MTPDKDTTRTMRLLPSSLLPVVSLLSLTGSLLALESARTWKASSAETTAGGLFDINLSTMWESPAQGGSVTALLDDWTTVEAALVVSDKSPGFVLAGSANYRDWTWLTSSDQTTDRKGVRTVDPKAVRFLRFDANAGANTQWTSALAGPTSEIVEAANAVGSLDWGDLSQAENTLAMAETAFEYMRSSPNNVGVDTDYSGIGWRHAPYYVGVFELWQLTGESKYRDDILAISNLRNWTMLLRADRIYGTGWLFPGEFFADDLAMGHVWLDLALNDPDAQPSWSADVKARIDYIMTEGPTIQVPGKPYVGMRGDDDWFWCDALFMGPPIYPRLAALTGDSAYNDFMAQHWKEVADYLYDDETHFFYRDAEWFDDREDNGAKVHWGRGNGWVLAALARVLEYLPHDSPHSAYFETQLLEMATALKEAQAGDGFWGASILYPEGYGTESSGTAFFTYGIAWGINAGILDRGTFGPVIEASWAGLARRLDADGRLHWIQKTGGSPVKVTDDDNRRTEYAYGALFLAAVEMVKYYDAAPAKTANVYYAQHSVKDAIPKPLSNRSAEAWTLLENFDTLDSWTTIVGRTTDGLVETALDPFDSANGSTVHVVSGTNNRGQVRLFRSIPAVSTGSVVTLYQRFALENPEIELALGLSTIASPVSENDLRAMLRFDLDSNRLAALSDNTVQEITDDFLQTETWYEVWLVIDRSDDTYQVLIKGGSNYPTQTVLADGFLLRGTSAEDLISYAIIVDTSSKRLGGIYLDDVQIDLDGINLTTPAGVQAPAYSPWSHIPTERPSMGKNSAWGWLWDAHYPWVYHGNWGGWFYYTELASPDAAGRWIYAEPIKSWMYVVTSDDELLYAWSSATGGWIFILNDGSDYYYDFVAAQWARFSD